MLLAAETGVQWAAIIFTFLGVCVTAGMQVVRSRQEAGDRNKGQEALNTVGMVEQTFEGFKSQMANCESRCVALAADNAAKDAVITELKNTLIDVKIDLRETQTDLAEANERIAHLENPR